MKPILTFIAALFITFSNAQDKGHEVKTFVGGDQDGKMSIDAIVKAGRLDISDTTLHITKFTMSFAKDGAMVQLSSSSPQFTKEMIEGIKTVQSGQKVYFEAIEATDKAGVAHKVSGVVIQVE